MNISSTAVNSSRNSLSHAGILEVTCTAPSTCCSRLMEFFSARFILHSTNLTQRRLAAHFNENAVPTVAEASRRQSDSGVLGILEA